MRRSKLRGGRVRQKTLAAVATFVELMHAKERGRAEAERDALVQLARLGIDVRFASAADGKAAAATKEGGAIRLSPACRRPASGPGADS